MPTVLLPVMSKVAEPRFNDAPLAATVVRPARSVPPTAGQTASVPLEPTVMAVLPSERAAAQGQRAGRDRGRARIGVGAAEGDGAGGVHGRLPPKLPSAIEPEKFDDKLSVLPIVSALAPRLTAPAPLRR